LATARATATAGVGDTMHGVKNVDAWSVVKVEDHRALLGSTVPQLRMTSPRLGFLNQAAYKFLDTRIFRLEQNSSGELSLHAVNEAGPSTFAITSKMGITTRGISELLGWSDHDFENEGMPIRIVIHLIPDNTDGRRLVLGDASKVSGNSRRSRKTS